MCMDRKKRRRRKSRNKNAESAKPSKEHHWYLFKVYINGEFSSVVKAPYHDAATSIVRNTWLVMDTYRVEVSRFMVAPEQ